MSEYQYYEFLAIDQPLNEKQMCELRAISTRAEITPTRFTNVYHYSDLKADSLKLLERYFDLHVYVANWGTNQLAIRIPLGAVPLDVLASYKLGKCLRESTVGEHDYLIINLRSDIEDSEYWAEGTGWMASLAGIRDELLRGDMRALYLAWLLCVEEGEVQDDEKEPEVPPGLGSLSAPLRSLVEFLRIDRDLLAAAAEGSRSMEEFAQSDLAGWITELSVEEKDDLLLRVAQGKHVQVTSALIRRFMDEKRQNEGGNNRSRRTLSRIRVRAEELQEAFEQEQTRKDEEDRRRKEAVEAAARTKYLNALSVRQSEVWDNVEQLIALAKQRSYDKAVVLLMDLSDLAVLDDDQINYSKRFHALRKRYSRKSSFIKRLNNAIRSKNVVWL
ncbi:MAG: hypothetical protein KAQ69_11580 [Spirochaetales bacterium]|nr:hypothetical protein [Spirochaetales bacterium]